MKDSAGAGGPARKGTDREKPVCHRRAGEGLGAGGESPAPCSPLATAGARHPAGCKLLPPRAQAHPPGGFCQKAMFSVQTGLCHRNRSVLGHEVLQRPRALLCFSKGQFILLHNDFLKPNSSQKGRMLAPYCQTQRTGQPRAVLPGSLSAFKVRLPVSSTGGFCPGAVCVDPSPTAGSILGFRGSHILCARWT